MHENVFSLLIQKSICNTAKPWLPDTIGISYGTGTLIRYKAELFVLTNEHVIRDATYIYSPNQAVELTIAFASKVHDLALLSFLGAVFANTEASVLPTHQNTKPGDSVCIIGFPKGGTNALVTNGIISRLTELDYNQIEPNIIYQLIAATDFGSSGSPVTLAGPQTLVGIASYRALSNDNSVYDVRDVCYMIPLPIINHFLECFAAATPNMTKTKLAMCDLSIVTCVSRSPLLRRYYLGIDAPENGILVTSSDIDLIQPGDFILSIQSNTVNLDGTVYSECLGGLVPYWHLIKQTHPGDIIQIQIMRNRIQLTINCKAQAYKLVNTKPKYIKYGPMIFTEVTTHKTQLSEFVRSTQLYGYDIKNGAIIIKVNDKHVSGIKTVKQCLEAIKTDLIKLEFNSGDVIIIPTAPTMQCNF
jgi:hypothetical protein